MRQRLRFIKIAAVFAFFSQPLIADTQISLTQGTSGSWNADWNGLTNRTDFFQWSLDLVDWHFAPVVEYGGGVKSYGFTSSTAKFFVRLEHAYIPSSDPEGDDYDYDSLSNIDEVTLHDTDPLKWDTDGDGLGDDWEIANNLDPRDDGSINPDNGANGDPDGDGVVNLDEYWYEGNPHLADTDGDGLSDSDELYVYFTLLKYADWDGDGLNDYAEVITYGTDPYRTDTDKDTLSDGDEVLVYSTNPLKVDSDGDWMWDDWELDHGLAPTNAADGLDDADSDGLTNQLEFVFLDKGFDPFVADSASFPWSEDPDYDGLTTAQDYNIYHTHPRQPDTDGDGLSDGWEILYGYPALINNETDANTANDPDADPDGDGLSNEDEDQIGTDPNNADTDSDGASDFAEAQGGSNPNNAASTPGNPGGTSGGPVTPPPPIVSVQVNFGDHSESHSEKYRVSLEPLEGDANTQTRYRSNRNYGETQIETFQVPAGSKYKVTLTHIGTDPNYHDDPRPDYDYTLEFPSTPIADPAIAVITEDPSGILGVHNEGDAFFASGKNATLKIPWLTSETKAVTPIDRARLKLGVGEEVTLKIAPSAPNITWSTSVGTLDNTTGTVVLLTLADATGPATVTVNYPGKTFTKVFTVYAPTGVDNATVVNTISYPVAKAGAGMYLSPVTVGPTDVSFYNVQMLEVGQGASNLTGTYFTTHPPPPHDAAHGADEWIPLDQSNHWDPRWDYARLGPVDCPSPWTAAGSFTWDIPAKWKVVGRGTEHLITGWNQVLSIQAGGTASVQKFGHTVTRTIYDANTSN